MVSDGGGVPEMGVLEVGAGLLQPGELAGGRKMVAELNGVTWDALNVGPLGERGRWGRKNIFCAGSG